MMKSLTRILAVGIAAIFLVSCGATTLSAPAAVGKHKPNATATPTRTATATQTPTIVTPTPTATNSPTPTATPVAGSVYLGVTNHPAPWDMTALDTFEADSGRKVAILSYFIGWQAANPPWSSTQEAVSARGDIPMITWEWPQIANLTAVINGTYDADSHLWAQTFATYNKPVFLRWGHEMNGGWFAWGAGVHGNTPAQFVAAWKHLHDIFQQESATNVQWIWSPNVLGPSAADFVPYFPGDSYVDWIALDGYNWAASQGAPWQTFTQIFAASYTSITALSSKPLMVAEWGSVEAGGDKGAWLRTALSNEIPAAFPRIKAEVYFNQNYDQDWRIESSPGAQAGYAAGVASLTYLSSWP